ncbi:MAG: Fic family protein [Lachnospiraceae bacterium]|nr:Fic family protein [Lachnospiraceae bacterium]
MIGYEDVLAYWKGKKIRNAADLDEAVNWQAVNLAYNSTKIEEPTVSYADTREIFEHGRVVGYTGDIKALFALQNAKRGWELFMSCFDERRPFDEKLVKDFHYVLTAGTYDERRFMRGERPGEYKHGDYVTGRHEAGALPEDVEEEMRELLEDMQDIPEEKALTAAAFFHAKFENIHAFADGNGRCGRLLMNYFLVLKDHPVISIDVEERNRYMEALEAWDEKQELEPLKEFLKEQTVRTWEKHVLKRS